MEAGHSYADPEIATEVPTAHREQAEGGEFSLSSISTKQQDTLETRSDDCDWGRPPEEISGAGWMPAWTLEKLEELQCEDPDLRHFLSWPIGQNERPPGTKCGHCGNADAVEVRMLRKYGCGGSADAAEGRMLRKCGVVGPRHRCRL